MDVAVLSGTPKQGKLSKFVSLAKKKNHFFESVAISFSNFSLP